MKFENNAKGLLDKLIYMNESSINREYVIAQLDGIAMMEGEARDQALQEYYMDLYKQLFRDAITYRETAANDMSILKEGQQLHNMSAQIVFNAVTEMMNTYCAEKNITPCEGKAFFGVDPEVIRDTIYGVCNEFKAIDTLRTAGRERKIDLLNEMRTNLDSLANKGYQYGTNGGTSDAMIEEMFIIHEERAAQYAEKGFWWKLRHPIDAIKTSWFISKTEKDLQKMGFNKSTHGVEVKARCEREPNMILKNQMSLAKDNCAEMKDANAQAEWRKNNPELTIARDKFEKALAYYEDEKHPERSFRNEVAHILDKYALDADQDRDFSKVDLTYRATAVDFDMMRDTSNIQSQTNLKFMELCKAFVTAALKKDEPINIKEIFKDATEYMEIDLKTFSVVYERDEYKDFLKVGVMPQGARLAAVQKRLLGVMEKKLDSQEIERIKNDMDEYVRDQDKSRESENKAIEGEKLKEPMSIPSLSENLVHADEVSKPITDEPKIEKEPIHKV